MIFKWAALITFTAFLFACKTKDHANPKNIMLKVILSKAHVQGLRNKNVYLVDYSKQSFIDSALVKGETIIFNQLWTPGFVPYEASIQTRDTLNGQSYLRPIGVQSPFNASFIYSSFYLDTGATVVRPHDRSNRGYASFTGGKQNEPFLKGIGLQFAEEPSLTRPQAIQNNISRIKAYPFSIHLLKLLFYNKEKFLEDDLKAQLSFFDDQTKTTPLFKSFMEYFATLESHDKAFPKIKFETENGEYQSIGSEDGACYLVVYWASWCVPCRQEIGDIKKLYEQFTKRGLNVTSISIDSDRRNWQTALRQEKMPWQQLLAIDSAKASLDLHYDIKAIPKAYFFNKNKELVKTFDSAVEMTKTINAFFENGR